MDRARDALAWLQHKRADVIVSDSMPQMEGLQLMRDVRALPGETMRPTPAIAWTAFAREEDRQRAIASGDHLPRRDVVTVELVGNQPRALTSRGISSATSKGSVGLARNTCTGRGEPKIELGRQRACPAQGGYQDGR